MYLEMKRLSDDSMEKGWKKDSIRNNNITCETIVVAELRFEDALDKGGDGVRMNGE